jgi:hypothetical protein
MPHMSCMPRTPLPRMAKRVPRSSCGCGCCCRCLAARAYLTRTERSETRLVNAATGDIACSTLHVWGLGPSLNRFGSQGRTAPRPTPGRATRSQTRGRYEVAARGERGSRSARDGALSRSRGARPLTVLVRGERGRSPRAPQPYLLVRGERGRGTVLVRGERGREKVLVRGERGRSSRAPQPYPWRLAMLIAFQKGAFRPALQAAFRQRTDRNADCPSLAGPCGAIFGGCPALPARPPLRTVFGGASDAIPPLSCAPRRSSVCRFSLVCPARARVGTVFRVASVPRNLLGAYPSGSSPSSAGPSTLMRRRIAAGSS